MGTFRVPVEIGDPEGRRYHQVEALVDTGSTFTTLSASLLKGLGVVPHDRRPFELGDGRVVEMEVGQTWVRIDGQSRVTPVVFGAEGSEPVLGTVPLETFLLAPDPVGRRLVPVRGLLK